MHTCYARHSPSAGTIKRSKRVKRRKRRLVPVSIGRLLDTRYDIARSITSQLFGTSRKGRPLPMLQRPQLLRKSHSTLPQRRKKEGESLAD